ncbi:hydrolase glyoxylase [Paenibacillus swuensis]|uniref:Hydrolase glyoxylase n=1 Tax=Paenibacillus swuensis TaxID=1178515 RepID=A0A172TKW2_9BACL|nr:MBL fold metallo-hydrolase [Paenibacillus swuensis]ANE47695.1 hydrolase glyoxylase [Paenibacillus swuensis]
MISLVNNRVTLFQSSLFQTTSTVVELEVGILIVDPTWLPHEIHLIQQHVEKVRGNKPIYLLFTHGDYDHIIGYRAFPGAITIGSLLLHHHPRKEHKLNLIQEFDDTYYIKRNYEIAFPELDIVIHEDGQKFRIGEEQLTFYKAPGHTEDGLFTVVESLGILIAGDYLSDFELPFIYDSTIAYEETLHKARRILNQYEIQLLIPGHGKYTTERPEMERRVGVSLSYIERLREAVSSGDEVRLKALQEEHPFPSSTMEDNHKDNVRIVQRDLGL